jgi:hypothetical protein
MNTNELGNWVRNWVHYDNLALGLNRQSSNARKVRDDYEHKIVGHLQQNHMENAIIQIAGGRLVVSEERHSQPLTLHRIEELLRSYFIAKGAGSHLDETPMIMKFLKQQRGFEVNKRLKKQGGAIPGPLPGPPGSQGSQSQLPDFTRH